MTDSTSATGRELDRTASGLAACLPALSRALDRRPAGHPHPRPPDGQLALLRFVAGREGATVREAAEALLMKPSNVSALVSRMTESGLLERRQDRSDRRVAHLYPTAAARRRLAEVRDQETARIRQALSSLSDGEIGALASAVGALAALTRHLDSSAR
ncbi:winged helix-turn-helix transcriptional regulator [Streptomyces sp. SBST2-5]|uniref:Winged helix-turn-helix transcriptional regulator n=1 Tax=Streptomyces composti TaxID=2720025 RepID=A0ABX1AB61_9ACTN|nr:MarR family winged helix-turn-helix transcriptional regulator [Streptomyces composti]NJP51879.1 winged helix-turn-helix transcriptional regulator [Streptomyces composti]